MAVRRSRHSGVGRAPAARSAAAPVHAPPLVMENGYGGFTADGREYVVVLDGDRETPLPWSNVLANPTFGTIVTQRRLGVHLGGQQPREPVDAVRQRSADRSDGRGDLHSRRRVRRRVGRHAGAAAAAAGRRALGRSPRRRRDAVRTRDRRCASRSSRCSWRPTIPSRFSLLTLTNDSDAPRRLSVFGYVEWVMGPPRAGERRFVVTEQDEATGSILARNTYNAEFSQAVSLWRATRDRAIVHVRPRGVRRAQPDTAGAGRTLPRRARRAASARRSIRAPRCNCPSRSRRASRVSSRSCWDRDATARMRSSWRRGLRRSSRRTRCSPPPNARGTRCLARSRSGPRTTRSI